MKKINKYVVTSILIIGIIAYVGFYMLIKNSYEMIELINSDISIKDKISETEELYEKLPNEEELLNAYSLEQKLINTSFYDDPEYGVIIKDTEGKLYFPYAKVNTSKYQENLIKLKKQLDELEVSLLYVQVPGKKIKEHTKFPVSEYDDYSNECADEFLEGIENNDISTLDLRENVEIDNLDKSSLFYKTDHHWTTETAFWAADEIKKYLNENYNFEILDKYFDKDNYNFKLYEKSFLGSLGRRVGKHVAGVDDYMFIYPKFDTNYDIFYPVQQKEIPLWSGNFYDTICRDSILNDQDITANKHASYFEYDYSNLIIKNKMIENDKKILIIKDSFSLPTVAFLSTGIKEIHLIDLRYEGAPKNIEQYVRDNGFDLVMIMYNTQVFGDTMFNFNS